MIDIKEVSFGYNRREKLFENISLQLEKGGVTGLLGKNGSGKTSLLKLIAGLVFPISGNCQVMGAIPKLRLPSMLQDLYFLPEDLYVPALTSDEYVTCYSSFYPNFDHALLKKYMAEFDLASSKLLTNFSHGQKKKFLIAFGLATHCRLLILDEPTNGLDIPSKAQFRKLLASSVTEDKLFIISTHQVHDVENLIDSIVLLDEGKIIFQQSVVDVTQKLAFVQQKEEPDPAICLYSEKQLGGYAAVIVNTQDLETQINLEILFNAILANKTNIQQLFAEKQL